MIHRLFAMAPMLFLILLAGASFWLDRAVQSVFPQEKNTRHDPDFWAENFTIKKFGEDGKLQNTLTASKLMHYPDDDTTVITAPTVRYYRDPPVVISSATGLISNNGKEVALVGNVQIKRETTKASPATQVETRVLTLFPDDELAVSREPVTITQGRSIIKGGGMESNHKTGVSVLSGRVIGTIYKQQ